LSSGEERSGAGRVLIHPLINFGLQRVLKWMVPARYDETLKKFPNYAEIW
jgi:hypothetical protein